MSKPELPPVDTSPDSTDSRIGSDGKITPDHGEHLKVKAINNVARSLIKRAEGVGGYSAGGGDILRLKRKPVFKGSFVPIENSRILSTDKFVSSPNPISPRAPDEVHHEISTKDITDPNSKLSMRSTVLGPMSGIRSDASVAVDPSNDRLKLGIRKGSSSSKSATGAALDVLNEHRRVIAAAERVVEGNSDDNEPERVA